MFERIYKLFKRRTVINGIDKDKIEESVDKRIVTYAQKKQEEYDNYLNLIKNCLKNKKILYFDHNREGWNIGSFNNLNQEYHFYIHKWHKYIDSGNTFWIIVNLFGKPYLFFNYANTRYFYYFTNEIEFNNILDATANEQTFAKIYNDGSCENQYLFIKEDENAKD